MKKVRKSFNRDLLVGRQDLCRAAKCIVACRWMRRKGVTPLSKRDEKSEQWPYVVLLPRRQAVAALERMAREFTP